MSRVSERLRAEITEAETKLLELVEADPARIWRAYELKSLASGGVAASPSAVGIAFRRLLESGELSLFDGDRVGIG